MRQSLMIFAEVAAFFGSDATAAGIKFQFVTRIKEDAAVLKEARANGVDCKDVTLKSLVSVEQGTQWLETFAFMFKSSTSTFPLNSM